MSHKSDIEIAREANKKPIQEIGEKLGIPTEHCCPMATTKQKLVKSSSTLCRDVKMAN